MFRYVFFNLHWFLFQPPNIFIFSEYKCYCFLLSGTLLILKLNDFAVVIDQAFKFH